MFSFSRPKTSTMVTFLKIRRQQWDRHLVSKRAQCSFVNVSTILVRSSFKGARNSKTIHTLKCRKPSETTRMPIFAPSPSLLFLVHNTCNHHQGNWSKVNPLRIVSMRFVSNETKEHGLYTGPGKAVWFHERETREPCPGNVENNVGQHSLLNFTSGTRTNKRETDDDDEK